MYRWNSFYFTNLCWVEFYVSHGEPSSCVTCCEASCLKMQLTYTSGRSISFIFSMRLTMCQTFYNGFLKTIGKTPFMILSECKFQDLHYLVLLEMGTTQIQNPDRTGPKVLPETKNESHIKLRSMS